MNRERPHSVTKRNKTRKLAYGADEENEVGKPRQGEQDGDDDEHLHNPVPIGRYER